MFSALFLRAKRDGQTVRVIYLSKNNPAGAEGLEIVTRHLGDADVRPWLSERGDKLPSWGDWSCDLLVSFLCPRIIPAEILNVSGLPINFHPAPPEYPGFGCYNFALYDDVEEYGVTCHRMNVEVDSGDIYGVRRFKIPTPPSVASLQEKSLQEMLRLLDEIMLAVAAETKLQTIAQWTRAATTRADFELLRQVPIAASREEVARRVRAFEHPEFEGAYVRLQDQDFVALPIGRSTK